MEQGEFEKSIREKLGQRTLTPSTNVWKKLEATLYADSEKRFNFRYWYWMAASIIVLVAVGSMFYNTSTTDNAPIEIVNTKKNVEEQQRLDPLTKQDNMEIEAVSAIQKKKQPEVKSVKKVNEKPETGLPTIANVQEQIPLKTVVYSPERTVGAEQEDTVEVVTLIKETTKSNEVTAAEIDLLLAQAKQQINLEKTAIANSSKVDATTLLLDVEAELNKPFKGKIFEMLKEGYEKGKILVAQRN